MAKILEKNGVETLAGCFKSILRDADIYAPRIGESEAAE